MLEVAALYVGFLNSGPEQVISAANKSANKAYGATVSTLSNAKGKPANAAH